jgi:hypothetical protein
MIPLEKPWPRTHFTAILFKRPTMAKMKANGRSMVEFPITQGMEILIASIYPLLLIAIASMSGTRSSTTHIRN